MTMNAYTLPRGKISAQNPKDIDAEIMKFSRSDGLLKSYRGKMPHTKDYC